MKNIVSIYMLVCFFIKSITGPSPVYGQDFNVDQLPVPGIMVEESVPFAPPALKGLVINLQKPLEFQFIIDTGKGLQDTASIKDQANQLVKYFLAGLTIPKGDLWVNLSPYEKDRMVPEALGQTDLGRDLLAQDYILKQLTASLIYPEKDLGKEFWSRVYAKARQQFSTTNIPVNTFNKVWILPDQAQVFENGAAAYVTKATLKVMLDEDCLSLTRHSEQSEESHSLASNIIRQIILPEITKEVNTGKNFAPLRQIYHALILAKWYKETIQNGLMDAVYTNKNKVAGVDLKDPAVKGQIYNRYLQAYKKGAFNYIKESPTPDGQVVPRKYFSGGITHFGDFAMSHDGKITDVRADGAMMAFNVSLNTAPMTPKISEIDRVSFRNEEFDTNPLEGVLDKGLFEAFKDYYQGIHVNVHVDFDSIKVHGLSWSDDWGMWKTRLDEAIHEALKNAINGRRNEDPGLKRQISLSVKQIENNLLVSIQDNGNGMEGPYFQALRVSKESVKKIDPKYFRNGFGVNRIIDDINQSGGKVTFENRPIERYPDTHGVTCIFEIPIASKMITPSPAAMKSELYSELLSYLDMLERAFPLSRIKISREIKNIKSEGPSRIPSAYLTAGFGELVYNAFDAQPQGEVRVRLYQRDRKVVLSISNNGEIDWQKLENKAREKKIEFKQREDLLWVSGLMEGEKHGMHGGRGKGLSWARQMAQAAGISLEVKSVDGETAFSFVFNLAIMGGKGVKESRDGAMTTQNPDTWENAQQEMKHLLEKLDRESSTPVFSKTISINGVTIKLTGKRYSGREFRINPYTAKASIINTLQAPPDSGLIKVSVMVDALPHLENYFAGYFIANVNIEGQGIMSDALISLDPSIRSYGIGTLLWTELGKALPANLRVIKSTLGNPETLKEMAINAARIFPRWAENFDVLRLCSMTNSIENTQRLITALSKLIVNEIKDPRLYGVLFTSRNLSQTIIGKLYTAAGFGQLQLSVENDHLIMTGQRDQAMTGVMTGKESLRVYGSIILGDEEIKQEYQRAYMKMVKNVFPLCTISFKNFVIDRQVWASLGRADIGKVIYGAAGADLTNVLFSTDAKTVYMVSMDDVSLDYLKSYINEDWDSIKGLSQQKYYAAFKYKSGYGHMWDVYKNFDWASGIVAELKTLGLQKEDLKFEEAEDGRPSLAFDLDLGKGVKEKRSIIFIRADLANRQPFQIPDNRILNYLKTTKVTGWVFKFLEPPKFKPFNEVSLGQVDGYYQRASGQFGWILTSYLKSIVRRIKPGGFLILNNSPIYYRHLISNNFKEVELYKNQKIRVLSLPPLPYGNKLRVFINKEADTATAMNKSPSDPAMRGKSYRRRMEQRYDHKDKKGGGDEGENSLYVTGSDDMTKTSYLDRHFIQWEYLRDNVLLYLVVRALERDREHPRIVVADVGSSTGEEIARTFYEIVNFLENQGEDPNKWNIEIKGIDSNRGVIEEAKKRIADISGFYRIRKDETETLLHGEKYADLIVKKLMQYPEKFLESVKFFPTDVLRLPAEDLKDVDLVLLNNVLRIFASSREKRQDIIKKLSNGSPDAVIAVGDYPYLSDSLRSGGLKHFFSPQDIIGSDTMSYFFGLPRNLANDINVYKLSNKAMKANGGIDFNQINVNRTGKTIKVQFNPAQLNVLEQSNFKGFTPVITDFKFIQSPFPLLGINTPAKETDELAKA